MTTNLETACNSIGLKLTSVFQGYQDDAIAPPAKRWPHFAWRVTLTLGDKSYTTDYRTGVGHVNPMPKHFMAYDSDQNREAHWLTHPRAAKPPSVANVVFSLISDANCAADSFETFCGDLGYDTDSRSALETYLKCQATGGAMRRMLGSHYDTISEASYGY